MSRFEAVYYEGETNERLPDWRVVEWTYVSEDAKSKSGSKVMAFGERDEEKAKAMASQLQSNYEKKTLADPNNIELQSILALEKKDILDKFKSGNGFEFNFE